MKKRAVAYYWCAALGIDLRRLGGVAPGLLRLFRTFIEARRQRHLLGVASSWPLRLTHPQIHDYNDTSGSMRGHYFHQDLWVAQKINRAAPVRHLDVGSRIDGFVAHVAAFRSLDLLDIRPNTSRVPEINYIQADITKLAATRHATYPSVSCLHALEHFGLGRYGDELDLLGHVKGFAGLTALTETGGTLYLSVPIGSQRIEFNAHRVFSVAEVQRLYAPWFTLKEFAYVDDSGDLHSQNSSTIPTSVGELWYGCGIFVLEKK